MGEDSKLHHQSRARAEETNSLLCSVIDIDQMIVSETELLEDSFDHGGSLGPRFDKIKDHAVRNAKLLEALHERLEMLTT